MWDAESGELKRCIETDSPILCLKSLDNATTTTTTTTPKTVVISGNDALEYNLKQWIINDVKSNSSSSLKLEPVVKSFRAHQAAVYDLRLTGRNNGGGGSGDGPRLITCSGDKSIRIWRMNDTC